MRIIIRRVGHFKKVYFEGIRLTKAEIEEYCSENKFRLLHTEYWRNCTIISVDKL